MSNVITSLNGTTPTSSTSTTTTKLPAETSTGQTLTQADFLKIMVAQFTQQDPLSSGDGSSGGSGTSDYVNELMSMTNLTTLQTMSGQLAQQLTDSLPGQTVEVDSNGNYSGGVVSSARVNTSDGGVYFTVNGAEFPASDLYSVNQTSTAASGASSTGAATSTTN